MEGGLLVKTGREGIGVRMYSSTQGAQVSVGWHGQSAAAECELGKLTHSVRVMVHACTDLEYINPTPLSVVVGHPLT